MKTGTQLALEGIKEALSNHRAEMAKAELIAEMLANRGAVITADDVRRVFNDHYGYPLEVGNAIGHLFSNKKKWELVGFAHSKRPKSHHRMIRTWRRREAEKQASVAPEVGTDNGERFCLRCNQETEKCTCQNLTS